MGVKEACDPSNGSADARMIANIVAANGANITRFLAKKAMKHLGIGTIKQS